MTSQITPVGSAAVGVAAATTLSVNPTAVGDVLVLAVTISGSQTITTATVSGGGVTTWQRLHGPRGTATPFTCNLDLWFGTVTATGAATITITATGSLTGLTPYLIAQQFTALTGATTVWAADTPGTGAFQSNVSSTNITFPTMAGTGEDRLYVGYSALAQVGTTSGQTAGYTVALNAENDCLIYNPDVSGSQSPVAIQTPAGTSFTIGGMLVANPGWLFPTVLARTVTATASSTSHSIAMPSGGATGDLYVVMFNMDGAAVALSTASTGWTEVGQGAGGNGTTGGVYAGIVGTAASTLVVTSGVAANAQQHVFIITGWSGTIANIAFATATGAGTASDPPSLTPAGGAKDFLWICDCSINTAVSTLPINAPASYRNFLVNSNGVTTTSGNVASAWRYLNAATEDPGIFDRAGSIANGWECNTIAIPPAVQVPPPRRPIVANQAALHRAYNF